MRCWLKRQPNDEIESDRGIVPIKHIIMPRRGTTIYFVSEFIIETSKKPGAWVSLLDFFRRCIEYFEKVCLFFGTNNWMDSVGIGSEFLLVSVMIRFECWFLLVAYHIVCKPPRSLLKNMLFIRIILTSDILFFLN